MRSGIKVAIAVPIIACGWLASASAIYCFWVDKLDLFVFPFTQWLQAEPYWRLNLTMTIGVGAGAAIPTAVLLLCAFGLIRHWWRNRGKHLTPPPGGGVKPLQTGVTDNHGHAAWMTMREARTRYPGPTGMVIGEAWCPRPSDGDFSPQNRSTWGAGGEVPLLIDPCTSGASYSSLEFSGPGGFKTSCAATRLLYWPGSAVVLDIASELGPMLTRDRTAHGHRVVTIGFGKDNEGIDALSWIDPSKPGAVRRVLSMTAAICGEEQQRGEDSIFDSAGRNIVAALLADLIWSDLPLDQKTITGLIAGISTPQNAMRRLLRGIRMNSASSLARHLAGTLMGLPDETFGGAYFNSSTLCSWLFDDDNARLLSGTVQPSDILKGAMTVFIQIPIDSLTHTPGLGRVIVDAFVSSMIQADGNFVDDTLMLLDEAFRLGGQIKSLLVARDQGRKFGIALALYYQSEGQLLTQWGKDAKSQWYEAVSWRSYSSIADLDTARTISAAVGKRAVLAVSEGENDGRTSNWSSWGSWSRGTNESTHEIGRELIKPEEVLHDMRTDEQIIFCRGAKPLRCSKAIYWRRSDLAVRVDANRFTKSIAAE